MLTKNQTFVLTAGANSQKIDFHQKICYNYIIESEDQTNDERKT